MEPPPIVRSAVWPLRGGPDPGLPNALFVSASSPPKRADSNTTYPLHTCLATSALRVICPAKPLTRPAAVAVGHGRDRGYTTTMCWPSRLNHAGWRPVFLAALMPTAAAARRCTAYPAYRRAKLAGEHSAGCGGAAEAAANWVTPSRAASGHGSGRNVQDELLSIISQRARRGPMGVRRHTVSPWWATIPGPRQVQSALAGEAAPVSNAVAKPMAMSLMSAG
jgi:hypothetical protein